MVVIDVIVVIVVVDEELTTAIGEVGDVPAPLLRPLLERCSYKQLERLEQLNPVRFCLVFVVNANENVVKAPG